MAGPGSREATVVRAIRGDPDLTPIPDDVFNTHPEWYSFVGVVHVNNTIYHMYDTVTDL